MKLSEYLNIHYPLYTNHISKRETRHDFFKNIDTELHAYLLGLIMSDGSIDDKRATLSHTVNEKDKTIECVRMGGAFKDKIIKTTYSYEDGEYFKIDERELSD